MIHKVLAFVRDFRSCSSFGELITDGVIDLVDRMASFELSKTDELDKCQSFARE